jgi:hypothetical protein
VNPPGRENEHPWLPAIATILIAEQCEKKSRTVRVPFPFIEKEGDGVEGDAAESSVRDCTVQNGNDAAHSDVSLA